MLDKDFLTIEGKITALAASLQGINEAIDQISAATKGTATAIIRLNERVKAMEDNSVIL